MLGVLSCAWSCVLCLELCPELKVMSYAWSCVLCLVLCPVLGAMSCAWSSVQCLELFLCLELCTMSVRAAQMNCSSQSIPFRM